MVHDKVGEGGYACVYRPPLKCTYGDQVFDTKYVGKIFVSNADADRERLMMKVVKRIDPQRLFSVQLKHSCNVKIDNENTVEDCKNAEDTENLKNVYQLIYPYAGKSLLDWCKVKSNLNRLTIDALLAGMLTIVRGLCTLNKKGYVHRDIKEANIMYTDGGDMRIIDFGLMVSVNELYADGEMDILGNDYEYYPPEFKVFYHLNQFKLVDVNVNAGIIKNFIRFVSEDAFFAYRYVEDGLLPWDSIMFRTTIGDLLTENMDFLRVRAQFTLLASKVDVFAFGLVFLRMLRKLPTSIQKQGKNKILALKKILKGCVDPNPITRTDVYECEKALSDFL